MLCDKCGGEFDETDRHHEDYDPTPLTQEEVTSGWFPPKPNIHDQYNPE